MAKIESDIFFRYHCIAAGFKKIFADKTAKRNGEGHHEA